MESSGSSFIPQRPTRGKVAPKSFRKVYILSYVSYLLFFSVLLAVGGIFFYKLTLQSQLSQLQQELVSKQQSFNQADLDRIKNLDDRIDAAAKLVDNHASLIAIFNALEKTVADPVQFASFNYNRAENIDSPELTISARADQFDEIIFQEQILKNNAITDTFDAVEVSLTTQPIDPEQLELGVQEVVNVNFKTTLSLSDINFTGYNGAEDTSLVVPDLMVDPTSTASDQSDEATVPFDEPIIPPGVDSDVPATDFDELDAQFEADQAGSPGTNI